MPEPETGSAGEPPAFSAMAFDYGLRVIGVAIGNSLTGQATPLGAQRARDGVPDWNALAALIREWQPGRLVVGIPLNMDGSDSEMAARARRFGRRLHGRFGLEVVEVDERLSSFEARGELLRDGRRDFREAGVDSLSAGLILESYFRSLPRRMT